MKKLLSILLSVILILMVCPIGVFELPAFAETASGTCGAGVTWEYDTSTATLTISGTGVMADYDYSYYLGTYVTTAPWRSYYSSMKTVVINSGVTSIGSYAFYGCKGLTSVTIPDSVTWIGRYAFYGCRGLTSVTIPDSVTSISGGAFYNTAWYNNRPVGLVYAGKVAYKYKGTCPAIVVIKDGTLGIADSAFDGCTGLTSVTIPDSVTWIGRYAFYGCRGLTSVTIPDSVTSISGGAFDGCTGLTSVTIPDSVTSIGSWAFDNTAWYNNQPDGLVYAGKVAYEYKGTCPANVYIKDGTLGIAGSAFSGCTGLTSITIPDSVTLIGSSAFSGCTALDSITVDNNNKVYRSENNCIIKKKGNILVAGCKNSVVPDSVTSIGDYAFSGRTGLTSITIPDSVTSIGYSAFSDCSGLTSITIPDSVTSIGELAFFYCSGLTSVTIPDFVTSINHAAFSGCTGLTSITIPDSVTSIGDFAFDGCTGLTSVTIGNSVTSIGYDAFRDCIWLKDIFYKGTKEQKSKISMGSNAPLTSATWHYAENLNFQPATCTKAGYTGDMGWEGYEVVTYGEEIPALGHDYIAKITDPTCTAQGYTTYTCSRCGDSYIDSYTNELGHNYNPVISDPTCTARGYTTHTCSRCGDSYIDSYTNEPGHNYNPVISDPTCTARGYTTYTCSRCGDTYKDNYIYMPCGENAGFIIKNNTLYIHGAGETNNWKTQGSVPWYDYSDQITEVIIDEGITKIGTYAFYCLNNLESVICKNEDLEFGRYALNTTNENLTVYSKNGALTEYCGNNGIRFIDVTATPELVEVTANSLTVKAVSGYEYSKDTVNWQTSGVFIGLSPVTEYNIYARLIKTKDEFPGRISEPLTVTTDKASVSAPPKPVCIKNTDTEITLKANGLYEYSIDGENWQKSNIFTGLIHKNTYSLYQRVAETETEYASVPSAPLIMQLVKKTVSAPAAPDYQSHTDNSITVIGNPAYEYSIDGENWQTSATFKNLNKNLIYRIYARVAETETEYASEPSAPLVIAIPDKPEILEAGYESVLVKYVEGFEYCLDDFVWQDSNTFDKLIDNTEYYVYQRMAAIAGEKVYQITSDYTAVTTDNSIAHTHTFGEWVKDIEKHWHICSDCGERLDEANHTESDWITDSEALPGVAGLRHKECTVCGYITETEIIPALAAYKPGDINGDDAVNNKDLTRLFQYLSDWEVEVNEAALDINGDGKVNNKDLTRLFQYLSGWAVDIF